MEALELRRQVFDDGHILVALSRRDLASVYFDLGVWNQALVALHSACLSALLGFQSRLCFSQGDR